MCESDRERERERERERDVGFRKRNDSKQTLTKLTSSDQLR